MPDTPTIGLFAPVAVALIAIPGPNALYVAARSLSQGLLAIAAVFLMMLSTPNTGRAATARKSSEIGSPGMESMNRTIASAML